MAISEVHKRLFQLYVASSVYANIIERYGTGSLRERLLVKLLKGVVEDIKFYLARRYTTP